MMTDQELADLKSRIHQSMVSGATIGKSNEIMLDLIQEVEMHRGTKPAPKKAEPEAPPPVKKPEEPSGKKDDLVEEKASGAKKEDQEAEDKKSKKK